MFHNWKEISLEVRYRITAKSINTGGEVTEFKWDKELRSDTETDLVLSRNYYGKYRSLEHQGRTAGYNTLPLNSTHISKPITATLCSRFIPHNKLEVLYYFNYFHN